MKTRFAALATVTAAGLSLWAPAAWAQQTPSTLATLPLTPQTVVDLTADVLYDSNIARSDRQLAALRGLTLADEIFTPTVDFVISRQLAGDMFFVKGTGSYLFHRRNTILNRESTDVTGGVDTHIARCQEVATADYARSQADLADLSQRNAVDVINLTTLTFIADCGRATGFAPNLTVTQSWRENGALQYSAADSSTLTATAQLAYRQAAFGSLSLNGTFSQADFPHRLAVVDVPGRTLSYDLYAGGLSYDRHLGGRIEGVASVSYTVLDPNSPALPGFSGFTFSADGTYHLNFRTEIEVLASRATTPSTRIDATYSIDEIYQANISYLLGSRLTLKLTVSSKAQDFRVQAGAPIDDLTHQNISDAFASVTFKLNRRINITLNGGDEERRANFRPFNYSSTRGDILIQAVF